MDYLKIAGVVFSLIGTIILAWRVTKILDALCSAVKSHDINFQSQALRLEGYPVPNVCIHGNGVHIEKSEKSGTKLLVLGFVLQIVGGICNVLSLIG